MTVAEYAARYLLAVAPLVAAQTFRSYEWALRCYVVPLLGPSALEDVTRTDVATFARAVLESGLQRTTTRLVLQVLRGLYSHAVDSGVVTENPARRPGRAFRIGGQAQRPALYGAELRRFLEVAETHAPQVFPLLLFLARTGCRLGEALGLEWQSVDLTERVALIRQQTWPRGRVTATKNGRAHMVDLSARLVLELHRLERAGPWVFPGPTGYPWHRSSVRRHFRHVLRVADLSLAYAPHSLRHGFASTLLQRGEPLAYVQRALDHGDPKLTATLYGCHLPNRRLSAVDGLDD
jgi:integrase